MGRHRTLTAAPDLDVRDPSHIEWLPVQRLSLDPHVNRAVNENRVNEIAKNFDPDFIGTITVSQRGANKYTVIDGQHRVRALLAMGWADQKVECRVFTGLTTAREAQMFNGLNTLAKPQYLDTFRIRAVAGDSCAVAVTEIITATGLRVGIGKGPYFSAVRAAERVYTGDVVKRVGTFPTALRDTLLVLTGAYGVDNNAVRAELVEGVGAVVHRYGTAVDLAVLTNKLALVAGGAQGLLGQARGLHGFRGGSLRDALSEVTVGLYNKTRRVGALPEWHSA